MSDAHPSRTCKWNINQGYLCNGTLHQIPQRPTQGRRGKDPKQGKKNPRAMGRNHFRESWRRRALPPAPRNPLPPALPTMLKMPTAKVPRMPKEQRKPRNTKSHSMGRRPPSPPTCANRQSSNEGGIRKLWIHPQPQYLHPSKCTSCAGQYPHGGLLLPFYK